MIVGCCDREKERQKIRDEAWQRVESQAMQNPSYAISRPLSMDESYLSNMSNIDGDIREADFDLTHDKIDAEARDVSLFKLLVFLIEAKRAEKKCRVDCFEPLNHIIYFS